MDTRSPYSARTALRDNLPRLMEAARSMAAKRSVNWGFSAKYRHSAPWGRCPAASSAGIAAVK